MTLDSRLHLSHVAIEVYVTRSLLKYSGSQEPEPEAMGTGPPAHSPGGATTTCHFILLI
jgi:hypothetical protein